MSTRTAAAATKLQQLSAAADDSESEVSMSSDNSENRSSSEEESDYESEPEEGGPPTKRARFSVASPFKKAASPTGREENLSLFPTMPLDVLFEILGQLAPDDLVNVSCINKIFRETLFASSAKTVWKHAFRGVGAPECPSDFTELRWAKLLFGTSCESCRAKNFCEVDPFLRRRVCAACKNKNLIRKSKVAATFPDCDDLILNLIPSVNVEGWNHGYTNSSKFYWRSDIEEIIRMMTGYKRNEHMRIPGAQDELGTFMAQRTTLMDEIQSTEKELSTWLSDSTTRRQDAIRTKFLELGYEGSDLVNLRDEKAFNGTAALTESLWKRIRPILERGVKNQKDSRLAIKLRDTLLSRRSILERLYIKYKNTISPLQWKYLPGVVEIGRKEPFKAFIHAELDVTITVGDLKPLMPKLPEIVTEIQDELKALLAERLTLAPKASKTLPSNCLDLATSVFRCHGRACRRSVYVVGTDDIASHNCGVDTYGSGYTDDMLGCCRDFMVDSPAADTARALVLCVGLDLKSTLASEMDDKDLRFACNACVNDKPLGYSWRTALLHASAHVTLSFGVIERLNDWRILSSTETTFLKQNEAQDPKWRADKWSCSHCPIALRGGLSREAVVQHVQTVHKIISPTDPADLFFFEKVVTPFRQPERLLYVSPYVGPNAPNKTKKVNCLICASGDPSAQNRPFLEQGVIAHLKTKHAIEYPVRGIHWAPLRSG